MTRPIDVANVFSAVRAALESSTCTTAFAFDEDSSAPVGIILRYHVAGQSFLVRVEPLDEAMPERYQLGKPLVLPFPED